MQTTKLLDRVTATGEGTPTAGVSGRKTYQAFGVTTNGAGSATIKVKGRNGDGAWDTIGTITLTLSATKTDDANSDGFTSDDQYAEHCGEVTAISGTGAVVSLVRSN